MIEHIDFFFFPLFLCIPRDDYQQVKNNRVSISGWKMEKQTIIFYSLFQLELVTRENTKKCKKSRVINSGNDVIMRNSSL